MVIEDAEKAESLPEQLLSPLLAASLLGLSIGSLFGRLLSALLRRARR